MREALLDPKEKPLIGDPLRGLVEQLKDAHRDLPDEQIRDVAKHSLDRFAKARIRSFVPVLAWCVPKEPLCSLFNPTWMRCASYPAPCTNVSVSSTGPTPPFVGPKTITV